MPKFVSCVFFFSFCCCLFTFQLRGITTAFYTEQHNNSFVLQKAITRSKHLTCLSKVNKFINQCTAATKIASPFIIV